MKMRKISFSRLQSDIELARLAIGMDDDVEGAPYLMDRLEELGKTCKPNRSIGVAWIILNSFVWGQDYQKSLASDIKRSKSLVSGLGGGVVNDG